MYIFFSYHSEKFAIENNIYQNLFYIKIHKKLIIYISKIIYYSFFKILYIINCKNKIKIEKNK